MVVAPSLKLGPMVVFIVMTFFMSMIMTMVIIVVMVVSAHRLCRVDSKFNNEAYRDDGSYPWS